MVPECVISFIRVTRVIRALLVASISSNASVKGTADSEAIFVANLLTFECKAFKL